MNEDPHNIEIPSGDVAFMELAIEMAMVEKTGAERDALGNAESMLREAVEFRRTHGA